LVTVALADVADTFVTGSLSIAYRRVQAMLSRGAGRAWLDQVVFKMSSCMKTWGLYRALEDEEGMTLANGSYRVGDRSSCSFQAINWTSPASAIGSTAVGAVQSMAAG
jgi:hypothetical protein